MNENNKVIIELVTNSVKIQKVRVKETIIFVSPVHMMNVEEVE